MNILVITDSIDVNDSSGSKANVAIIQNLVALQHEVTVLHYTRKIIPIEGANCMAIPELKWRLLYLLSRAERFFTRKTGISINRFLESWFGFSFTFLNDVQAIQNCIKKHAANPDWVFTLSKGASFRPHYALLKAKKWHRKWVCYIHDPYPFHFYPRPYNWVQPGYRQKELFMRAALGAARHIAFPSQLLAQWMQSYFEEITNKSIVIPHQYTALTASEIPQWFSDSYFNVAHLGLLSPQRNPEHLIKGFVQFLEQCPQAVGQSQLLLIGPQEDYRHLTQNLPTTYQQAIVCMPQGIPFAEALAVQKAVSVNVVVESVAEISPFLPAKLPHLVAAQKPILVLGPYYSEVKRILGPTFEYWSEANDAARIALLLSQLYHHKAVNYDAAALEYYLGKEHLRELLEEL